MSRRLLRIALCIGALFFLGGVGCSHFKAKPEISTFDPPSPLAGIFTWTATGSGFDASSKVVITGRGCESGCTLLPGSIISRSSTEIKGLADLTNQSGSYTIQIINDSGASNLFKFTLQSKGSRP